MSIVGPIRADVNMDITPSGNAAILVAMADRTQRPFVEELPDLLRDRQLSVRQLARDTGVTSSHFSRLLRGIGYRTKPSKELAERVAIALGLPPDYFVEYREGVVLEAVRTRPRLREELYDRVRKR
jgi:transcriptional regulator with XRE-family HTH domain